MNRLTTLLTVACAGLLLAAGPARAQNVYQIKVDLDQSVNGELGVVKAVLSAADAGEASPALRGLAARLTAEFQVGLSDRVSDTDVLTLDDGSMLTLLEGDELKIISKKCLNFPCAGANIVWGKGHGRPMAIFITNAYGECVKGIRWGKLKGTHRPQVTDTCDFKDPGEEIPKGDPDTFMAPADGPATWAPEAEDARPALVDRRP